MKYLLLILLIIMTGCTTKIVGPEPEPSCEWSKKLDSYSYIPFPGNSGVRQDGFTTFDNCEDYSMVGESVGRVNGHCQLQYIWVCE